MKETFYFSHDYNARSDEKIKRLLVKHGFLGYGVYWAIVEDLYQNANAMRTDYECIAYELRVNEDCIKSIINDFDLFEIEGDVFGSLSVQRRLDERDKKSKKARESALYRWNKNKENANAMRTQCDSNAIKESKGKESKVIKKINKKKEETGDGLSRNKPTTKQLYPDVDFDCEEEYKPILQEWFDYKRSKKQNYTPKGRLLFYRKLVELSEDNTVTAQKIVDQSIAAPWTGIYPLITDKKNAPARNNEAGTRNTSNKRIDYSKIKVQKISEL